MSKYLHCVRHCHAAHDTPMQPAKTVGIEVPNVSAKPMYIYTYIYMYICIYVMYTCKDSYVCKLCEVFQAAEGVFFDQDDVPMIL